MSMTSSGGSRNILLDALANDSRDALTAHLERIDLPVGYKCASLSRRIESVYFPPRGIIGRVAGAQDGARVGAGIYGRDGCSGIPLVFGLDRSPHDDIVQVAGEAVRAPVEIIADLLRRDASFRALLLHFVYCLSLQASFSALSSMSGDIRKRLCRLLIMCLDRSDGQELMLTHGFLATTLGVRRASVTSAIHHLEGDRLIKATRGRILVRERGSLLKIAGTSYGPAEREYGRLICDDIAEGPFANEIVRRPMS